MKIDITLDRFRAKLKGAVKVNVTLKGADKLTNAGLKAKLLILGFGVKELHLKRDPKKIGTYEGIIRLDDSASDGIYPITVYANKEGCKVIGKASFLLGKIVGDFFSVSSLPEKGVEKDIMSYMREFLELGGNMITVHSIISRGKAHYPSRICKTDVTPKSENDLIEVTLRLADKIGLSAFLSASWDKTSDIPYSKRTKSVKSIIKELWKLYAHHPSLIGFYSYQEGSGTYYLPYMKEFCNAVKAIDKNLLTACAPYIDDPLLAGYLSTVKNLDIVIYQGAVMASYRPDNRKMYPLRRVKDFSSLSAGGTLPKDKITLSHVELFGTEEMRIANASLTTYENIIRQILSAACVYGTDGITFFTYHVHIYNQSKLIPQAKNSGLGVKDGMKAYGLISKNVSTKSNNLALYYPYTDWCIERWTSSYIPALDSFRRLGMPIDIIPYSPPDKESTLPYYPMNMNENMLEYFQSNKYVLVLPNLSGFQKTDSDLIDRFVEDGGVVVAFGPRIPKGRSYDRTKLFGGDETPSKIHSKIIMKKAVGDRVDSGKSFMIDNLSLPSWSSKDAEVIAAYEDDTACTLLNKYGKGRTIAVLVDIETASEIMPNVLKDIFDFALSLNEIKCVCDVAGANENMDFAMTNVDGELRAVIVNHNNTPVDVSVLPLDIEKGKKYNVLDLITKKILLTGLANKRPFNMTIDAYSYKGVIFRKQ